MSPMIDEPATVALAEYDIETRFRAMAARGSKRTGLALLAKRDRAAQVDSTGFAARLRMRKTVTENARRIQAGAPADSLIEISCRAQRKYMDLEGLGVVKNIISA